MIYVNFSFSIKRKLNERKKKNVLQHLIIIEYIRKKRTRSNNGLT